ncbi:hypothetical protein [Rhizobium sp. 12,4]|uniref:hypothetical protein n=1 Tax=Rhizobium sp. 12,4 TaxID=3405135 RepID=UPI003D335A67
MTRHASLAEQLSALKAYVFRAEQTVDVDTNWSPIASCPAQAEDLAGMHAERRVSIRPTWQEIVRQVETGDVEYGWHTDDHGKKHKVVVRIGKLKFSDGTQTERCMMAGIDGDPVTGLIRMPVGAMLGTKEEQERTLGGNGASSGESNAWFSNVFGVEPRAYVAGGKKRRGRIYSRDEAASMLADAIANTPIMPPVTRCPDGMAMGTQRIADNFIGMKKSPKGNGGSIAWQDLSDKIAERETFIEAERLMTSKDKAILAAASSARNMSDIGAAAGLSRSYSIKKGGGRRALLAANDNLMAAIKKASA